MPSIQDVADQINARLDQINTNTSNTAQNTADIKVKLDEVNSRLTQANGIMAAGFANLSQGLHALLQVQLAALEQLDHQRKQNDTIICELINANNTLCNIMRKTGKLVGLETESLLSLQRGEGISERVNPGEASDYDRHLEIARKQEECCPPKGVPEEPCPPACTSPIFRSHVPLDKEWKPLPKPQTNDLLG